MALVSKLGDPILSCVPWSGGGTVRRLVRGSLQPLVPVAFLSGRLCVITIAVILGLSTLQAVCPFLY
jgi:hypothetical protein